MQYHILTHEVMVWCVMNFSVKPSVSSVIQQNGDSAMMIAARWGWTEVVSLLLKAGANKHLQNKVKYHLMCMRKCPGLNA